jgi:hypothetical protein
MFKVISKKNWVGINNTLVAIKKISSNPKDGETVDIHYINLLIKNLEAGIGELEKLNA